MGQNSYYICFQIDEVPSDPVETAVELCIDHGFDTIRAGGTGSIQRYSSDRYDRKRDAEGHGEYSGASLQTVSDEITEDGQGEVTLWHVGAEFTLHFDLQQDQPWHTPKVSASFNGLHVAVDEQRTRAEAQARIEDIIAVTAAITTRVDAEFVCGENLASLDDVLPMEHPRVEQIERVPWLVVLSEPLVADFGGKERVLQTPAWRVEELDTGHVLIVRTDNPVDPTEGPSVSPEKYLLEGKSLDDLQADDPRIDDPFRHLAPGDLGADVVIDQADVSGDPTNEDLELVRCEVDDEYRLWNVETGEFVRRVFDEDGESFQGETMVPGEESHPPLVHAGVPVEFVELDAADDENVVTKVMALDVEIDKLRLLVSLASMVEDADDREAALDTVESTIDDAKRAEDVDGIERLLRRLL